MIEREAGYVADIRARMEEVLARKGSSIEDLFESDAA